MKNLSDKTAFITGGASGIGLGMARVFAREGMNVIVADIREDHLDDARAQLQGAAAHFMRLDVTDRQGFAAALAEAKAAFGPVHLLCNNAGIGILKNIISADYADWDWTVDVHLNGVFNGIKTFLPHMLEHGEGGHIVNTASMAGILQYSQAGLYVATKFAVVGLSEALRAELAPQGIGVSAFCPGGVRSNIREYERTRPERFVSKAESAPSAPRFSLSGADRARLADLTATPEQAGEMVLKGVQDNALYIFTAPEFRPGVEERFDAIRRALGHDEQREEIALELIPGLVSSPIYKQT